MRFLILAALLAVSCISEPTFEDYMDVCVESCSLGVHVCGIEEPFGGCEWLCANDHATLEDGGQDCLEAGIDLRECYAQTVCGDTCPVEEQAFYRACRG